MNFKKEYECEAKAIITDAFIFTDFKPGELPDLKFFTHVAAWDTGAEHTSISMEVVKALQLQPVGYDSGIWWCQEGWPLSGFYRFAKCDYHAQHDCIWCRP